MSKISIKSTNNLSIVKFELEEFITRNQNFEFKNIDETANSPLAKQLFFLPFVKSVYISGNFIAIEKFSIVEWNEVKAGMKPTDFNIHNALERIKDKGDLFKPVLGKGIDMMKALELLQDIKH